MQRCQKDDEIRAFDGTVECRVPVLYTAATHQCVLCMQRCQIIPPSSLVTTEKKHLCGYIGYIFTRKILNYCSASQITMYENYTVSRKSRLCFYQCCGSGMFYPGSKEFFHPGYWIPDLGSYVLCKKGGKIKHTFVMLLTVSGVSFESTGIAQFHTNC
jgi:hypothetical protein